MYILGISAFFHDSAACLIRNEEIIAAAQEERFTRKKHDESFPAKAIEYVLKEANISIDQIDYIGFFEKPLLKFERLLETYLSEAPRGFRSFAMAMPIWLKHKLFAKQVIVKELVKIYHNQSNVINSQLDDKIIAKKLAKKILFGKHHQSHSASCFYPSPYKDAAILTMDGVGEWATTSIAFGSENKIEFLKEIKFPHSLGLFYSAFTYFLGFKVNSGEYKVMGLAPYGESRFVDIIKSEIIDIKEDGSFCLNIDYFDYLTGLKMTNKKFAQLFQKEARNPESEITQFDMDLAASLQKVTEEIMIKLARTAKKLTNSDNLVMAGGVALNCVGNGKIKKEGIFKNIFIQPAAGDAGGAMGVAFSIYYHHLNQQRKCYKTGEDNLKGSYLGYQDKNNDIKSYFDKIGAKYHFIDDKEQFLDIVAQNLSLQKVVGWHQGRMEFGPRALGARSIIGDATSTKMQSIMNLKIKYRESFRPFAPAILEDKVEEYFDFQGISPYMLMVAPVKDDKIIAMSEEQKKLFGIAKLNIARSVIPAVTHIDYSARIQTISKKTNPLFYQLINKFYQITNFPVVINTSFNVRGEPIVCNHQDSYRCFMRTKMDLLAIENFILYKDEQPDFIDNQNWQQQYQLD